LVQWSYESFINKGKISPVAYTQYLNDIATFFSDDLDNYKLTSVFGLEQICTNKSCVIGTFEIFITNYAITYGGNFIMPYVSTGPGNSCIFTAHITENAAYILPGNTSPVILDVISLEQYHFVPCIGLNCAHPWLIKEWLSLDYLFLPSPTPLYENDAALRAFPLPS